MDTLTVLVSIIGKSALPVAVRFVTSTYQTDVEEETGAQVEEKKEVKDVL